MESLTFTQKVSPVIMKVLLLAATVAIASAAFAPSCEECNQAAAGLLARLTSAESIAEQTGILISQVCPQAADALLVRRLSLNGGETWPTAFILLSSELATPVSALVFAGEEFSRRLDLRRLHRDHDQGRRLYAAT